MANIIAVIWDCDKTLIDGYMQDPIFRHYNVDSQQFWKKNAEEIIKNKRNNFRVNEDTFYLNMFIRGAHDGTFPGLNNEMLHNFGAEQKFYKGIPEFFQETKDIVKNDKSFSEYGIQVEHYIVSTGFAEIIRGSVLMKYVEDIWGCEMLEGEDSSGNKVINEIAFTLDNTTKTRAIFEINKGRDIPVNSKVPEELRRVRFENMIYIADGPSDVPAFSVVKKGGGATFAIYPRGNSAALRQVEKMREDGRVDMYAEADYSEGTTANMWITEKIKQFANRIKENEQLKIKQAGLEVPKHLDC